MSPKAYTAPRDLIVIGASAGGLAVLCELVSGLPRGFPAALFVVIHTSADNPGVLPQILARAGSLPVAFARDGERIERGRIYVASPDHHLLVERGFVRVTRGPKENGFRPAVDPLFRTAARSYGPRVIGLVLSGALNDGTHGLAQIAESGGIALAQDPEEALIPSMPLSAIQNVEVRRVLRTAEMAGVLADFVREQVEDPHAADPQVPDTAEVGNSLQVHTPSGKTSGYTCPDCGGALWELAEHGQLLRFHCHVGHAFTAEVLAAKQESNLEVAMWSALRALEEHIALSRRMADRAEDKGYSPLASRYRRDADEDTRRAALIRNVLDQRIISAPQPADADALEQLYPAEATSIAAPPAIRTAKPQ
ncbi:MAG: chemotaxis protein CheB [Nannocystis sp.]|nr:chemotaxis protein CheB [Nannocystis sp.]MBA3548647.1 chemotaxis protein CheB [Nannocystis sp.]